MTIEIQHTCMFCGELWAGDGQECPRCQDGRDLRVFEPSQPSLSREDVGRMLAELRRAPRPQLSTRKRDPALDTQQFREARYVCPVCYETTVYRFADDFASSHLVLKQLLDFRRAFKRMSDKSGLALRLDERGLCRNCRPYDTASGRIHLTIEYADGTTHTAHNIDERDVELLHCFFAGDTAYSPPRVFGYVKRIPLKKRQPQLRELLGFPQTGFWSLLHCYLRRCPRQGNWD